MSGDLSGDLIIARHILVSGVVQGVGYRYWTVKQASELGLCGWVRNLDDGRVEIHAEGPPSAIEALVKQCGRGPRSAEVSGVTARDCVVKRHPTFASRATGVRHLDVTDE